MKKIAYYLIILTSLVLGSCESTVFTRVEGNGSIEPDFSEGHVVQFTTDGSRTADFNFEAIPDEGWEFVEWIHYGESYQTIVTTQNIDIVVGAQEDHTVWAVFRPIFANIVTKVEGNGVVNVEVINAKDYERGSDLKITAVADEGWVFKRWEGILLDDDSLPYFYTTSDEDLTVTAYFEQKTVDITVDESGLGTWFVFDDNNLVLGSTDLNNTLKDIPVGTTLLFDAESNEDADFKTWEVEVTTEDGTQTENFSDEDVSYTIGNDAEELTFTAYFLSSTVVVPSGGIFDVNQFEDFMDHFLPATKGGIEDYHPNHQWEGLELKSSNLEVYFIGDYGKNLYTVNHHYAEEGYIDYSEYGGEKWSYGYNNLGQVSSITYDDMQLDVWYNGDQDSYTSIDIKFIGEVVYTLNPVIDGEGSMKFSVPGDDLIIEKSYTVNELGQVTQVSITGAPENPDFSVSRTHSYNEDGYRQRTEFSDGRAAAYNYISLREDEPNYTSEITFEGGFELSKRHSLMNGHHYVSLVAYLKLLDNKSIFEYRNNQNKPTYREILSSSSVRPKVNFTKVDKIGRPEKGEFYEDDVMKGSFEIVDGKMTWKDADGMSLSGDAVSDWMRDLMQVFDDSKPYNDSFYSYDELYYL